MLRLSQLVAYVRKETASSLLRFKENAALINLLMYISGWHFQHGDGNGIPIFGAARGRERVRETRCY